MNVRLSEIDLELVSTCLREQVGLNFPRERWQDMERGIGSAARDFEFQDPRAYVEWLLASPLSRRQIEVLAGHLTVGETYFFREKAAFEVFETRILAELIRERQVDGSRIRIWSAGCASGEEPYSIAIALDRTIGREAPGRVTILATDINPRSLDKAAAGVYGDWSFRGAPQHLKVTYFRRQGRHYEILPRIKRQVLFSFLNLAEDAYPSLSTGTNAMDVIFCRNVLMYFSAEQARKVAQKFSRCLVDGGWLIVSPCEASAEVFSGFNAVHLPGVILYRKKAAEPVRTVEWFTAPEPVRVEHQESTAFPFNPAEKVGAPPPILERSQPDATEPMGLLPAAPGIEAASTLYAEGSYARAVEVLESGEDQTAQAPEAMALAARAFANQGKLAEALAHSERAIEKDKVHAGYHYLRATILLEQGARDEARQTLKRTLYLDADFVLAHLALANLARQQNDAGASSRHLQIAQRLLSARARDEVLPESEGMTAGRLLEIVETELGVKTRGRRHSAAPVTVRCGATAAGSARAGKRGAR
jgi:chemotaxis protein methyltransferase CheR